MPKDKEMNGMRRNRRCHKEQKPVTRLMYTLVTMCRWLPVVAIVALTGCSTARLSSFDPSEKIAPEKMQDDFVLLKKILEANHPSLYWYTPKDSLDGYFNEAYASMSDSMTELAYKNRISWYLSKIDCGHTSAGVSDNYLKYVRGHLPARFPLLLKCWNDSLVVLGSMDTTEKVFKRGVVITSIDGRDNKTVIDSIFRFISTDGYSDNFRNQAVSFNFPMYYGYAFPLKDSFLVGYIDSTGWQRSAYVKLFKPKRDSAGREHAPYYPSPRHKDEKQFEKWSKRSIDFDSANRYAYMRIATFNSGNLTSFFKESFKEINKRGISNLIVDLRENTGGKINLSTKFARYIKDTSFRIADTVAAVNRSLPYSKYIKPALPFRVMMRFTTHKKSDGRYHFSNLENEVFRPYSKNHFDGNVYIIQGGYTFSAAAMLVSQLKGQHNVTVVGEETGGGNYGMSAVHLPTIVLPNTKVRVSLPLYRIVTDSARTKDGRGIMPDVYVPPSSVAIKNGIDPKMQKVKELIWQKENNH